LNTNIHICKEGNLNHQHSPHRQLAATAGFWIGGKIYWVRNRNEKIIPEEGISLHIKEVPLHSQIKFFEIYFRNHLQKNQQVKLVCKHYYPYLAEEHFAFVSPVEKVLFHMANQTIYLVNASFNGKGMQQMTVLPQWYANTGKIWKSLEKGVLSYQPMAKGMPASIFAIDLDLPAGTMRKAKSWIIKGNNKDELLRLNRILLKSK